MSSIKKPQTPEKLKEFGLVMCLACMVLAGVLLLKGRPTALLPIGFGAVFLVLGIFSPTVLEPVERIWMQFAEKLSVVVTYIIVTLTFFLIVTPMGIMLRLFGKDLLQLRLEPEIESYWQPVDPAGPGSRPYLPY